MMAMDCLYTLVSAAAGRLLLGRSITLSLHGDEHGDEQSASCTNDSSRVMFLPNLRLPTAAEVNNLCP